MRLDKWYLLDQSECCTWVQCPATWEHESQWPLWCCSIYTGCLDRVFIDRCNICIPLIADNLEKRVLSIALLWASSGIKQVWLPIIGSADTVCTSKMRLTTPLRPLCLYPRSCDVLAARRERAQPYVSFAALLVKCRKGKPKRAIHSINASSKAERCFMCHVCRAILASTTDHTPQTTTVSQYLIVIKWWPTILFAKTQHRKNHLLGSLVCFIDSEPIDVVIPSYSLPSHLSCCHCFNRLQCFMQTCYCPTALLRR